jgi:hypothetical protein
MANREHINALEPLGKGILGTTLRYDYEVRDGKNVFAEVPNPRVPTEMLELAEHILETKAGHFDPKSFKDDYELAAEAGETKGRRREDRRTPTRRGHRKSYQSHGCPSPQRAEWPRAWRGGKSKLKETRSSFRASAPESGLTIVMKKRERPSVGGIFETHF